MSQIHDQWSIACLIIGWVGLKSFYLIFTCVLMWLLSGSAAPVHNFREFSVQFITSEDESVENLAEELKVFSGIYCGLRKGTAADANFNSARYEYKNGNSKYKFEVSKVVCDFPTQ
ncbi:MAG: hypothetical protein K0R29_2912 [Pseudobdellovibrio sp.]|jgi:hypothetical protein|nr:hypothetical protein [Pseudobdellovibrio sp.]